MVAAATSAGTACNLLTGVASLDEIADAAGGSAADARDASNDRTTISDARVSIDALPDEDVPDTGEDAVCDADALATDPRNCGMCGKNCGFDTCVDASCVPLVLASGLPISGSIAVDPTGVYFLTTDGVGSVPLDGGPTQTVASGVANLNYIALSPGYVYASVEPATGPGPILRFAQSGGATVTLAAGRESPNQVAVYGDTLYWAEQGDGGQNGAILGVPLDGGPVEVVIAHQVGPEQLAVDSLNVYYSNWDNGGDTVVEAQRSTGGSSNLDTLPGPLAVAIDDTNVYFSNIGDGGAVYQVNKSGGMVHQLMASPFAEWVVSDGTHVYFTDRKKGEVVRVPVGGGTPVVLASGLPSTGQLVIFNGALFVAVQGTGSILRMNR
jgi:hypothetical protein